MTDSLTYAPPVLLRDRLIKALADGVHEGTTPEVETDAVLAVLKEFIQEIRDEEDEDESDPNNAVWRLGWDQGWENALNCLLDYCRER